MAGSYQHCVDENGDPLDEPLLDNMGDAKEAIEEMVHMIQYLSGGGREEIFEAYRYHINKKDGNIEYVNKKGVEGYWENSS